MLRKTWMANYFLLFFYSFFTCYSFYFLLSSILFISFYFFSFPLFTFPFLLEFKSDPCCLSCGFEVKLQTIKLTDRIRYWRQKIRLTAVAAQSFCRNNNLQMSKFWQITSCHICHLQFTYYMTRFWSPVSIQSRSNEWGNSCVTHGSRYFHRYELMWVYKFGKLLGFEKKEACIFFRVRY